DLAEIEAHLLDCVACCDALAAIPADPFLSRLRDARAAFESRPTKAAPPEGVTPAPATELTCLPDQSSSPPPGTPALAGLEDLREVGRGGMGVVYSATHSLMGRRVAVKVIHPEFAANTAAVERFRRESQAAARLAHPNLV